MKRLLTAGIFGTILGIVGAGTAKASIVSSGFLDEKLTEYALSTSLDLKANQSDFTELNTQISDAIDNFKTLWNTDIGYLADGFDPNQVSNDIDGAFNLVDGFIYYSMRSLTGGWTDKTDGTTYLGVKDLNTKIGSYYWGPENEEYKYSNIPYFEEFFPDLSPDKSLAGYDMATNILINYTQPDFPGLAGVTYRLLNGWWDENRVLVNPGLKGMYGGWIEYGNKLPGLYEIASDMFKLKSTFSNVSIYRLLADGLEEYTYNNYTGPVYPLWKLSEGIDKIETKIGDLPTEIPNMNLIWEKYGYAETGTPIDLPDTIGGMFAMLFSDYGSYNEPSLESIMARILMGFSSSSNVRYEGLSSLTSVYNLIGDSPIVTAVKANTAKIGTLPDGYDSVGAALTAIKGIAEDAKAAALAAIPDPKQEGSSGKFVLTVDIVGDNATYHWEKIDREGETTTTTE